MRRLAPSIFLVFLLPAIAAAAGAPQMEEERSKDAAAIRAHIDSIFQAYINKDREVIRATHSEDWRGFLRPSREVIKGIEGYMQAAEAALSGPYGLSAYRFIEYDVVFYDDMAVVNYVAELTPRRLPIRPMIRVIDVYAKHRGHWMQVASQTAPHPDSLAAGRQQPFPVHGPLRQEILDAREDVWRAWFENGGDLKDLVPPDTLAINAGEEEWKNQQQILDSSAEFVAGGGKLLRLEFPRTEIQMYGDVAVLYSLFEMEMEVGGGQRIAQSGRATEIFVRREGRWVNPGWHLDSGD